MVLNNAIDIHVHHGPDALARKFSAYQLAQQAKSAGMRGLVLKSHHFPTGNLATQISELVPGISVFGGIALNGQAGGLNPEAIRLAARQNTKLVWLPTSSSTNHIAFMEKTNSNTLKDLRAGAQDSGYYLMGDNGKLLTQVTQVLEVIAQLDLSVATGHISPQETFAVLAEVQRLGMNPRRLVINHPDSPLTPFTLEEQMYLTRMGAFIERVALLFLTIQGVATTRVAEYSEKYEIKKDPIAPTGTVADFVELIRKTGIKNNILAADLGQIGNVSPVEGLTTACALLKQYGLKEEEIRCLTSENPSEYLGLGR